MKKENIINSIKRITPNATWHCLSIKMTFLAAAGGTQLFGGSGVCRIYVGVDVESVTFLLIL